MLRFGQRIKPEFLPRYPLVQIYESFLDRSYQANFYSRRRELVRILAIEKKTIEEAIVAAIYALWEQHGKSLNEILNYHWEVAKMGAEEYDVELVGTLEAYPLVRKFLDYLRAAEEHRGA